MAVLGYQLRRCANLDILDGEVAVQGEDIPSAAVWAAFRTCELWASASDEGLRSVLARSDVRELPRGTEIFHEGEPAAEMGIVITGHVRAVQCNSEGRCMTVLTASQGDSLGVAAMIPGSAYAMTFEAVEDSLVAIVPREALVALVQAEPQVHESMEREIMRQLTEANHAVRVLLADVPARLAAYILSRREGLGPLPEDEPVLDLGVSRVELAVMLGTTPETLSRCFREFESEGIVRGVGRQVAVLDEAGLVERAHRLL